METNCVEDGLVVEVPQPTVHDSRAEGRYRYLIGYTVGTLLLATAALVALWFCLATFAPSGTAVPASSHRGASHPR
jgi:hypothetical protein